MAGNMDYEYTIKVKFGSDNVEREKRELPHVIEHLISRHMTKKYGFLHRNAYTGVDYTMYKFLTRESDMENRQNDFLIQKFLKNLIDLDINEELLQIEKEIIKEEIYLWPYTIYKQEGYIHNILYGGKSSFPSIKSLGNIKMIDVKEYIKKYYVIDNLEVITGKSQEINERTSDYKKIRFDLEVKEHDLRENEGNSFDYKMIITKPQKMSTMIKDEFCSELSEMLTFYRNPNYPHYRTSIYNVLFDSSKIDINAAAYSTENLDRCFVFWVREEFDFNDFISFLRENIELTDILKNTEFLKDNDIFNLEEFLTLATEIKFSVESEY